MTSLENILPGITNIGYNFATRQGKGVQGEKELPCCTLSTIRVQLTLLPNLLCQLPPPKQIGVSVRLRSLQALRSVAFGDFSNPAPDGAGLTILFLGNYRQFSYLSV